MTRNARASIAARHVQEKVRAKLAHSTVHPKEEAELRERAQANVKEDIEGLLKLSEMRLRSLFPRARFIAREETAWLTRALEAVR